MEVSDEYKYEVLPVMTVEGLSPGRTVDCRSVEAVWWVVQLGLPLLLCL
jgi:hypothetical protein